jgi:hypothetical protein
MEKLIENEKLQGIRVKNVFKKANNLYLSRAVEEDDVTLCKRNPVYIYTVENGTKPLTEVDIILSKNDAAEIYKFLGQILKEAEL